MTFLTNLLIENYALAAIALLALSVLGSYLHMVRDGVNLGFNIRTLVVLPVGAASLVVLLLDLLILVLAIDLLRIVALFIFG